MVCEVCCGRVSGLHRTRCEQIRHALPSTNERGVDLPPDMEPSSGPAPDSSFFGGCPFLPAHTTWPTTELIEKEGEPAVIRSMVFVGQINCGTSMGLQNLPHAGMLYLLVAWDAECGVQEPACKVIYELAAGTARASIPANILRPRAVLNSYAERQHTARPGDESELTYPCHLIRVVCTDAHHPALDAHISASAMQAFYKCGSSFAVDPDIASKQAALGSAKSWPARSEALARGFIFVDQLTARHQLFGHPHRRSNVGTTGRRAEGSILFAQFETDELTDWDWNAYLQFRVTPDHLTHCDFENVTAVQVT